MYMCMWCMVEPSPLIYLIVGRALPSLRDGRRREDEPARRRGSYGSDDMSFWRPSSSCARQRAPLLFSGRLLALAPLNARRALAPRRA